MRASTVLFYVFALIFISILEPTICTSGGLEYQELQEFLAEYEPKVAYQEDYRDVVLVLGNTGDGKTTFTQWIAGDDSQLISTEKGKFTGEFIITDSNRISNSTIVSKTIYPELVVEEDSQTAYYDISGFGDSRGIKYDIATSYFIKRIIEHVDNVKILLVVSYPSVRFGVDRKNFMQILKHFTELVKNSDKYLDGIGLIVTKVENAYYTDSNGSTHLVSDDATVSMIASFLDDVAIDLNNILQSEQSSPEQKKFSNASIEIIDALISNNHERIALFRRPNIAGPLNKISLLQKGKQKVRKMVNETLQFIPVSDDDFSYTVSDNTKVKLHNLVDAMETTLVEDFNYLASNLHIHDTEKVDVINKMIEHELDTKDFEYIDHYLIEIKTIANEINENSMEIFMLASLLENTKQYKAIPDLVKNTVSKLNVTVSDRILSNISSISNFLQFIKDSLFLEFKLDTVSIKLALEESGNKIKESNEILQSNIDKLTLQIEQSIKSNFTSTINLLKDKLKEHEKKVHAPVFDDITELKNEFESLLNRLLKMQKISDTNKVLYYFNDTLISYDIHLSDYILQKMTDEYYFKYFSNELELLVVDLNDSRNFYKFLDEMFDKLSSYEIFGNQTAQNRCSAIIQNSATYEGRKIQDTNIGFILQDCDSDLYNNTYDSIKNVNLTHNKIILLEDTVNLTMNNGLLHICNETKLTVEGRFVKLSDVDVKFCISNTQLQIFASEKVYIDVDLDFTGQNIQLSIMSPTWVIVDNRKIVLDGSKGEEILPTIAAEGEDGKPGEPGGNAGHFLAYGITFINGENLLISANGGDGGSGQNGGTGKPGKNGEVPEVKYKSFWYGLFGSELDENLVYWKTMGYKVWSTQRDCSSSLLKLLFYTCTDFFVSGQSCSNGGTGGKGGVGGKGGAAGTIKVFSNASFVTSVVDGQEGIVGSPGQGGWAGRPSVRLDVLESKVNFILWKTKYYDVYNVDSQYCYEGDTPCCDFNSLGRINAPPQTEFFNQTAVFDEFYDYLDDSIQFTPRKTMLRKALIDLQVATPVSLPEEYS